MVDRSDNHTPMTETDSRDQEAGRPSHQLSFEDAVEVWLLHWQGWLNHRIAARFDCNQGRISEVLTGKRQPGSEAEAQQRKA